MVSRFFSSIGGLALAAILVAATGCSANASDEASGSTTSNFTVESGDRFVVSASPERVVLKKKVDGVDFPFDEASLRGKALLIHPISSRADAGVYTWANKITVDDDTYTVEGKPLSLQEMTEIAEDDIVRIYVDKKHSTTHAPIPTTDLKGESIRPLGMGTGLNFDLGMKPQVASFNGFALSGGDLGTGINFGAPMFLQPGISVTHKVQTATLKPQMLLQWADNGGVDLGFQADMDWKSQLIIKGKLAGEFFRTPTIEAPPMMFFLPVGFVPVPMTITALAYVSCFAQITGPADVTLDIAASASIGGSMRANPRLDTDPSTWLTEGRWPNNASASAGVTPNVVIEGTPSFSCALPRMEFHVAVAGVVGPYVAVSPSASMSNSGGSFQVVIGAGLAASAFGSGVGIEANLYTWKPQL